MKIFEIVIFVAVILALAILLLRKGEADNEPKTNEPKTAELRRVYKDYNAYHSIEYIECECGYSKELRGIWLIQSDDYWEGQRCPCCGRRWVFKKKVR